MTSTNSRASNLRRRLWLAFTLMAAVSGGAFVLWAETDSEPSGSSADCAVVENIAQQWNTTSATVRDTLLNGGGQPDDYGSIADLQTEMAGKLRGAANSVSTPVIKLQLSQWADGAAEYATLHRSAADRAPETPALPQTGADFERVARSMIDNAAALGEVCPEMPSAVG